MPLGSTQPLKSLLITLGLLLAFASALLGIAGLAGGLDPRLDLASHLAPVSILVGLIALPFAFAGRRSWRAATLVLAIAGAGSGALLVAPEWLRSTEPTAPPGAPGQIKVIEFNVWHGNQRLPEVVDWLAAQHPDVVILEESGPQLRNMIAARTGWKGVMGYASSIMIITPPPYVTMNRPVIDPLSTLTFVNATYASQSGPYEVVATHLDWPGPRQARERKALRGVISKLPTGRMILAGDFNSTPWSFARRQDDRGFGLIRRDRAIWSWPADIGGAHGFRAPFPFLPIDHLYAGPGWATVSVARGPRLGSDHYPLIVTLAPASPAARYPENHPGR